MQVYGSKTAGHVLELLFRLCLFCSCVLTQALSDSYLDKNLLESKFLQGYKQCIVGWEVWKKLSERETEVTYKKAIGVEWKNQEGEIGIKTVDVLMSCICFGRKSTGD